LWPCSRSHWWPAKVMKWPQAKTRWSFATRIVKRSGMVRASRERPTGTGRRGTPYSPGWRRTGRPSAARPSSRGSADCPARGDAEVEDVGVSGGVLPGDQVAGGGQLHRFEQCDGRLLADVLVRGVAQPAGGGQADGLEGVAGVGHVEFPQHAADGPAEVGGVA